MPNQAIAHELTSHILAIDKDQILKMPVESYLAFHEISYDIIFYENVGFEYRRVELKS